MEAEMNVCPPERQRRIRFDLRLQRMRWGSCAVAQDDQGCRTLNLPRKGPTTRKLLALFLRRDPLIDPLFEHIQG